MITRRGYNVTVLVSREVMDSVKIQKFLNWAERHPGVSNVNVQKENERGYSNVFIYATPIASRKVQAVLDFTELESPPNAGHDHQKCIDSARALGVPESWAHTPETYLSM